MNRNNSISALACDYDGTLTDESPVDQETLAALIRFKDSGRKLLLVTGREIDDLREVFPEIHVFDSVVAENGAVLYQPATSRETLLADPPPRSFLQELRRLGVVPLSVGRCVVATVRSHSEAVRQTIKEMKLDSKIILNRKSLMVLPAAIDKAVGLELALEEFQLRPEDCAGIGDAENDESFLSICGFYAAVANALPGLRDAADLVTDGENGAGVTELIDKILSGEMARIKAGHNQRAR